MAQQTAINGNRYSFTSITVNMDGNDIPKGVFMSINYDATQDPGIVQGNQVVLVGRTEGYGVGTGSFEMLVSEWDDFASSLTQDNNVPLMSVDFDITVSYSVNDIDTRTDVLRGCRITKVGSPNQKGNDATAVTCEMSIARVRKNGIDMFADAS
jgi:hypothetical protein